MLCNVVRRRCELINPFDGNQCVEGELIIHYNGETQENESIDFLPDKCYAFEDIDWVYQDTILQEQVMPEDNPFPVDAPTAQGNDFEMDL